MLNVSKVMQVHLMQVATDRWRDVPYTDAAKMTDGVLQPKYDKQEDIYPGLLATLKEAADGFADGGSDDLGEETCYSVVISRSGRDIVILCVFV